MSIKMARLAMYFFFFSFFGNDDPGFEFII